MYTKTIQYGITRQDGKKNRRVQVSYNTTSLCFNQPELHVGGTAMVVFKEVVFRITKQGHDKMKLGQWSCKIITGKTKLKPQFYYIALLEALLLGLSTLGSETTYIFRRIGHQQSI